MKSYEIHLEDWSRIFSGHVPAAMYLELVFRAAYLFALVIVSMRLLGKRMAAQLSRNDMAALVSLAAAIGVPMVAFDRGLLPSTIIAVVVIGIARLLAAGISRYHRWQHLLIGRTSALVKDGVINAHELLRCGLSRERLFAQLRSKQITQLGEVRRLYLEDTGSFSLLKEEQERPGLLVLPSWDKEFAESRVITTDQTVCLYCGHLLPAAIDEPREHCKHRETTQAVKSK